MTVHERSIESCSEPVKERPSLESAPGPSITQSCGLPGSFSGGVTDSKSDVAKLAASATWLKGMASSIPSNRLDPTLGGSEPKLRKKPASPFFRDFSPSTSDIIVTFSRYMRVYFLPNRLQIKQADGHCPVVGHYREKGKEAVKQV
ncbi:hypothetical protein [Microbulbifer sp. JSM ZJ756]|uniref:hypothetical protein n=1 Tax=Microbulbifer sp. JSM ZJ756 TaxID=3376191 RepID=UPI00379BF483